MSPKLTVLTIFLVVFGLAYLAAFLRMAGNRDPEWEARWKQLHTADRRRIWRAVRRGEKLEDPDEARLAAGSARFQRQLIWHPTAGAWTMLAIFTVAALAVALNGNLPL